MRVGVPTEIKSEEFRVGITPSAAREYVNNGHEVIVQSGAGNGIGADDVNYQAAGATIARDAAEVFAQADMIVKVKEPQLGECEMLRREQILFTYLHLAADPKQAEALLRSGCAAIAYETVTDRNGGLPLLAPMSEVAGRLSILAAADCMTRVAGGRGLLIGGVPGVPAARIVIIGGGVVGTHAARMAAGLGAEVTILDRSLDRMRELDDLFMGRVRTCYSTADAIDHEISSADAVIGAVLLPGASAPKLVSRPMLAHMKPAAVLVDVAIDQGGCFETSKPTTHSDPTYIVDGIIHYCVANMPGSVPRTSAHALNNATLPYGLRLAARGLGALADDAHLAAGLNIADGMVTNKAVADSIGHPYSEPKV